MSRKWNIPWDVQVDGRFRVWAWGYRGAERWTRVIRDPKGMSKFVPQLRCSMPKRTVSYPETWLKWRTEESDQVWWPSWTWRLYGDGITKVLWAWELKKLISSRNNFIFDTFRNFEPVKRFENVISTVAVLPGWHRVAEATPKKPHATPQATPNENMNFGT